VPEDNIFDQTTTNDQQTSNPAPAFQIPTEALDFVGDGRKYSSVEDALKSVPHAQKHIQTLESELAQAKEELTKRRSAEELLEEIRSELTTEHTTQAVAFDESKLVQLVDQTLSLKEKQRAAEHNAIKVADKFTSSFGDKAQEVYNALAKDSGMSVQELNALAAKSPNAVLKLAGLLKGGSIPSRSSGSVNTESFKSSDASTLSARVPRGASTKDLVAAWRNAGEKIKQNSI